MRITMRITKWVLTLMVILASHVRAQDAPLADHHQHLFSPDMAAMLAQTAPDFKTINARDLIALLDSAGIRRALLLSTAYIYGSPSRSFANEDLGVITEGYRPRLRPPGKFAIWMFLSPKSLGYKRRSSDGRSFTCAPPTLCTSHQQTR